MPEIHETGRPQYGKGSNHNEIADMLVARRGGSEGDEARTRLATARGALEARTANLEVSLSHQGSDFGGPGVSAHMNDAFVDSATKATVIAPLFRSDELPADCGDILKVPRVSASVTPTAGLDAATVATATPTTAMVSIPVATISAMLVATRQFLDLVLQPGGEAIVGEILGRRYTEAVDAQLLSGTGASGQTIGLDATTSPTAFTYTNATPTSATHVTAIMKTRAQVAKARGVVPDTLIWHPTLHSAYVEGNASADVNVGALERGFGRIVEASAVPITLGAGTASEIILACSRDLRYWARRPVLQVAEDYSGLANAQVAIAIHGYLASPGANLDPTGLGLITGTGTTAQTGYGA